MNYGIPYQGSKSKIAENICRVFPRAENFYDLFGGGFSITHCMLLKRGQDYKQFHFNEIRKGIIELIQDAIKGRYSYQNYNPEWVSREDFLRKKESDALTKMLWSFGNNGLAYLFGKEIEDYKRSMHMAVVFNSFDSLAKQLFGFEKFADGYSIKQRRLHLRNRIEHYRKTIIPDFLKRYIGSEQLQQLQQLEQIQQLQQLHQLQQLEQLERLQQLEQLEQLELYNVDYQQIKIKENSVVYCDIPYFNTSEYDKNTSFNRNEFYRWAKSLNHPLYISEYRIDMPFLTQIYACNKRTLMSPKGATELKIERVYCNDLGLQAMRRR